MIWLVGFNSATGEAELVLGGVDRAEAEAQQADLFREGLRSVVVTADDIVSALEKAGLLIIEGD